ncbi:helix-turn-helix domain-containing protein [Soonwooa sp.]|uniref:helix-turn-helix domain-containing protein n=1 Tax=Soonwooa sp. TaxID=1938592 RepID=UPI00262FE15C|nr:helix-turn-helix domain-containing protein [Soonwooa sp.]
MSKLKKIREQKNLTQEELSELSGISVRTIQRIESGTSPKGFTLKALVKSLDVSERDFLENTPEILETSSNDSQITTTTLEEKIETNFGLIKIINLSTLPVSFLPIVCFLPPLILMLVYKQKSNIVKQIISLQILWSILAPIIFMIIIFMKLGKSSAVVTMIVLALSNIFIILRNAMEIDRKQKLYFKLNFNLL